MGLNCLLISTNQLVSPYPVYPLGIAHLAGAMQSAGHHVVLFDFLATGDSTSLAGILENSRFDLIALSIRNIDTADSSIPGTFIHYAADIMAMIRRNCDSPVVVGGPAFSILPEVIFEILQPDYGVVGEGEYSLPWLADSIAAGKSPTPGIIRAKRRRCPWRPVSYSKSISDYYIKRGGMLNVQTKRGCPYKCGYCSYPSLEGTRVRCREPEEVADEVGRLSRDFGAKYIFFADAVFNDPGDHYLQVAEALIKNGSTTPWCAFFRPQDLSRAAVSLMKRAGLAAMEFGTDATSDKTLAGLRKGFSFADVIKTEKAAAAEKIPIAHFIIFGGPGEDEQSFAEGLANLDRLKQSVIFGCLGIRVLPNTAIHGLARKEGLITGDENLLEPVYYYSPQIERAKMDHVLKERWRGRFDRIYPWGEMEPRIKHLHGKGHVGPMWDFLIKK